MFINATTNEIISKPVVIDLLRRGWTLWRVETGEGWQWGNPKRSARYFRRQLAHVMWFTSQWNDTPTQEMVFWVNPR